MTEKQVVQQMEIYVDQALPLSATHITCVQHQKLWLQKIEFKRKELKERMSSIIKQLEK